MNQKKNKLQGFICTNCHRVIHMFSALNGNLKSVENSKKNYINTRKIRRMGNTQTMMIKMPQQYGSLYQHGLEALSVQEKEKMRVEQIELLYQYASQKSEIDHPLCIECSEIRFSKLEQKYTEKVETMKIYKNYLLSIQEKEDDKLEEVSEEKIKIQREDAVLTKKLNLLQIQELDLLQNLKKLEILEKKLSGYEKLYWQEYDNYLENFKTCKNENLTVTKHRDERKKILFNFEKLNIYNEVFHIWFDGHFGTINGFRLGKLQCLNVDWDEINAAWGQAVLLLQTLSVKKKFKFTKFKLHPMSSFSKISSTKDGKILALYGPGTTSGFYSSKFSKFDMAMVYFLGCLDELMEYVKLIEDSYTFPYLIKKDKIGGLSVRLSGSTEIQWTRAMKHILINLKWLLVWAFKT